MSRIIIFALMLLFSFSSAWPATYSVTLTAEQEAILTEELAYRNLTITHQQALQRLANREMNQLSQEQTARTEQDFSNMIKITTTTAVDNAEAALAAGIIAPTITDIPNQTHNVGQAVTVPIVATNPYASELALTFRVTGLPPGITFGSDANGAPQLSGKPTTAGTYNVTIAAYNVIAVQVTDTLTWTINP